MIGNIIYLFLLNRYKEKLLTMDIDLMSLYQERLQHILVKMMFMLEK